MRCIARAVAQARCAAGLAPVPPMPGADAFAPIGDLPCGTATEPQFDPVIDTINATPRVRFVLHTAGV